MIALLCVDCDSVVTVALDPQKLSSQKFQKEVSQNRNISEVPLCELRAGFSKMVESLKDAAMINDF